MRRVTATMNGSAAPRLLQRWRTGATPRPWRLPQRRWLADARRPSAAPKPMLDIKHIRQNAELYERTCSERNYRPQLGHAARIVALHARWQDLQREGRALRERSAVLRKLLARPATATTDDVPAGERRVAAREQAQDEARRLKAQLAGIERDEADALAEMEALALEMPNLTDPETPRGHEPVVLRYINEPPASSLPPASPSPDTTTTAAAAPDGPPPDGRAWRSHVHIGAELGILDFAGAATASGWGWYYLVGEAAQLEQALAQYALREATRRGWTPVSPPSIVYGHVGAACGFLPRDQHGEQQVYALAQSPADARRGAPARCLAGTSEIALAAMAAATTLDAADLPLRRVAVSRCYRAEAGARGLEAKGLYRVHEFTKVEMFAWTAPDPAAARAVLDDMLAVQADILAALGLPCRVLAMPAHDLGASAAYKVDVEAYFPGRRQLAASGWGEVTSASLCTDYQARRLATRVRIPGADRLAFPYTANATALAVPRVLASLLENGWDEETATVAVPECLRPWMDGRHRIGGRKSGTRPSAAAAEEGQPSLVL